MITHSFQSAKANSGDPTIVSSTYWNAVHLLAVANVSAGRAITAADGVIFVTTGGSNQTFTLPAVSANPKQFLCVKKVDSGAGQVILSPNGADTFDGGASYTLAEQNQCVLFTNDGISGWQSLGTN